MGRFPTIEEAKNHPYSAEERAIIEMNRDRSFIGSPATVRENLTRLADASGTSEIMITTMTHEHADRRRSYELLAEAFSLSPAPL
jgi:alkanesulfonate monooxygenase SsuD/methylene tetrahydromethanopterin reductase-like flavin-dependent oxidoreductase (luciferase family)